MKAKWKKKEKNSKIALHSLVAAGNLAHPMDFGTWIKYVQNNLSSPLLILYYTSACTNYWSDPNKAIVYFWKFKKKTRHRNKKKIRIQQRVKTTWMNLFLINVPLIPSWVHVQNLNDFIQFDNKCASVQLIDQTKYVFVKLCIINLDWHIYRVL